MNTLADIAIDHFCLLMFEGPLDPDDASSLCQVIPAYLEEMTTEERAAFSAAARRALTFLTAPPDKYGYSPAARVGSDQLEFLRIAASGEIFECLPDSGTGA